MGSKIDNYGCMGETERGILSEEGWREGTRERTLGSPS